MKLLCISDVGIVQMPCPELLCLGLDRGNIDGSDCPILEENTRIHMMMSQRSATSKIRQLVQHLIFQILNTVIMAWKYGALWESTAPPVAAWIPRQRIIKKSRDKVYLLKHCPMSLKKQNPCKNCRKQSIDGLVKSQKYSLSLHGRGLG